VLSKCLAKRFVNTHTVLIDAVAPRNISPCSLRPDIQLIPLSATGQVFIIDVKVPFPIPGFIEKVHNDNVNKYSTLAGRYFHKYPRDVPILTIIIPSVGPNLNFTASQFRVLGFIERESNRVMSNRSSEVARKNFLLTKTLPTTHVPGLPHAVPTPTPALPDASTEDLDLIDPDDAAAQAAQLAVHQQPPL